MGVVGFALLPRNIQFVSNNPVCVVVNQAAMEVVMPTFRVELAQTVIERATVCSVNLGGGWLRIYLDFKLWEKQ